MTLRKTLPILLTVFLVSAVAAQPGTDTPDQPGEKGPDGVMPDNSGNGTDVLPDLSGDLLPSQASQNAANVLDTIGQSFSEGVDGLGERLGGALSGLLGSNSRTNSSKERA